MSKIKIHDPFFGREERRAVEKVFESHLWASPKDNNKASEFEKKFQSYLECDECVAVDSGSAALLLSLSLMDIKNKEVIIPSFCHISLANAVVHNGGKPVFVDINPKNLCLDVDLVKKAITKKTKAIVPVHFGGIPCDINKLKELSKNYKINLIEDAALATGSNYKNKKIGSHSELVCFSFHPVKIIAAPKGGAIALNGSNSKKFKKILSALRNSGISQQSPNSVSQVGWNSYMNEFSAAICLEQLKKLNKMISIRYQIAEQYHNKISIDEKMPLEKSCSYNFYWLLVKNPRIFTKKMRENNIEVGNYHPPTHISQYYQTTKKLVNTEFIAKHHVLLPTHPNLSTKDVEKIIKLSNKFS